MTEAGPPGSDDPPEAGPEEGSGLTERIREVAEQVVDIEDPDQRARTIATLWAESYRGPLPDPQSFERFERTLPGAAERILVMAENYAAANVNAQYRTMDAMDRKLDADIAFTKRGQLFGAIFLFAVLCVATYLILEGHEVVGIASIFASLGAILFAMIRASRPSAAEPVAPHESGSTEPANDEESG